MKIFLALLMAASIFCGAAEVDFHSGKISRAELSAQAPQKFRLAAPIYSDLPANPVYASVTLKFNAGRSISLFDYAIHIFGKNYPCIAIWKNGKLLTAARKTDDWRKVESTSPEETYKLLFILDSSEVTSVRGQQESFILKPLFAPSEEPFEKKISFKNLDIGSSLQGIKENTDKKVKKPAPKQVKKAAAKKAAPKKAAPKKAVAKKAAPKKAAPKKAAPRKAAPKKAAVKKAAVKKAAPRKAAPKKAAVKKAAPKKTAPEKAEKKK